MASSPDVDQTDLLLGYTATIVTAHVTHNEISYLEVSKLIRVVYETLVAVNREYPTQVSGTSTHRRETRPAATPDILTCLECGMRMKMLKRHLLTVHGLTPEAYRQKHGLPPDAPMVTSNYAALRSELAKASGLGKRPGRRGGSR